MAAIQDTIKDTYIHNSFEITHTHQSSTSGMTDTGCCSVNTTEQETAMLISRPHTHLAQGPMV